MKRPRLPPTDDQEVPPIACAAEYCWRRRRSRHLFSHEDRRLNIDMEAFEPLKLYNHNAFPRNLNEYGMFMQSKKWYT